MFMIDIQTVIVFILFGIAVFYIVKPIFKKSKGDVSCGGCSKCAADFSKIDPEKKV
jgi:large-conductance mechanosensitive channel